MKLLPNIYQLLIQVPRGTMLYSEEIGTCILGATCEVSRHGKGIIYVDAPVDYNIGTYRYYTMWGTRTDGNECLLWPSETHKSWEDVKVVNNKLVWD